MGAGPPRTRMLKTRELWSQPVRVTRTPPTPQSPSLPNASRLHPTHTRVRRARSVRSVSIAVRVLLALSAVVAAVFTAASLRQLQLIGDLKSNALSVGPDTLLSADRTARNAQIAQLLMVLLTGIPFLVWFRRAYRNLAPLGAVSLRFMPGWATGAWFVPILGIIRPKQILDDIWRASDPAAQPSLNKSWAGQPVPVLIHLWWVAWVGTGALGFIRSRIEGGGPSLDGAEFSAITAVAAGLSAIVAALLAILVVTDITNRQHERADRIRLLTETPPISDTPTVPAMEGPTADTADAPTHTDASTDTDKSRWMVAAVAAVALLVVPASYLVLDPGGESPSSAAGFTGEARLVKELDPGDCYNLPDNSGSIDSPGLTVLAADVVPCSSPHQLEVVATTTYGSGAGSGYPGDSEVTLVGIERCLGPFEEYVGAPWPEGGLDMFVVQPLSETWAIWDRGFVCAAVRMDGADLDHSIEHSGGVLSPGQVTLFGVNEGECFTLDDAQSLYATLGPCSGPHQFEAYARVTSKSSTFPGADAASEFSDRVCAEQFSARVEATTSPNLGYAPLLQPFESMWRIGKRDIVCVIWDRDSAMLSSSYLVG